LANFENYSIRFNGMNVTIDEYLAVVILLSGTAISGTLEIIDLSNYVILIYHSLNEQVAVQK